MTHGLQVDYERDSLLSEAGKAVLRERYLLAGETPQDAFARVAKAFADDKAHAQRLYDYMSRLWFMPSTPVLANGGTGRGLPVSCFLNEATDSMEGITGTWNENVALSAHGGGIGTNWSQIRSVGEPAGSRGKSTGVVPFIVVQDSMTRAIEQGSARRGAAAVYLNIHHPDIEEFLAMRQPQGGDPMRKALYLHSAVVIDDAFMRAVEEDGLYDLKSPKTGETLRKVEARPLWAKLLASRLEQGEPYLLFVDNVNKALPPYQKKAGLTVKMSNLCCEAVLPTGVDQYLKERTAVCCLSSVNLEHFEVWSREPRFVEDLMRYLDNILQFFIDRAPPSMERARYGAMRERAVGLGAMGFHSFLQSKGVAFESEAAREWNRTMFGHLKAQADKASVLLAEERGPNPDAAEMLVKERFSHKIALAPTAVSSMFGGGVSPGIEPYVANVTEYETADGWCVARNNHLRQVLQAHGKDDDETWAFIAADGGSVRQLAFLSDAEKDVFKTAFEIDPTWILRHAAERLPLVCQSQSLTLYVTAETRREALHDLHVSAWKQGLKTLYACRSQPVAQGGVVRLPEADATVQTPLKATGTDGFGF